MSQTALHSSGGNDDSHAKQIALRVGQLGAELAASALQLGAASSVMNAATDIWRIRTTPKEVALAAELLGRHPDLLERLEAMRSGNAGALRDDEFELIGDGMAAIRPSATNQRIERIARLVSSGLGTTDIETSRAKRLMRVFAQLDDEHLVVLMHYDTTARREDRTQIAATHRQLFPPPPRPPGILKRLTAGFDREPEPSPPTDAELAECVQQQLHLKLCQEHLRSLGLLRYDETENGPDTRNFHLSLAGHEFLRAVGLLAGAEPLRPFLY